MRSAEASWTNRFPPRTLDESLAPRVALEVSGVTRDSLFGERIVWSGRAKVVSVPPALRAVSLALATTALVATAGAVLVATAVHLRPGSLLIFAGWCATLAVVFWHGPAVWRAEAEYIVTDHHVMWKRGRIRRTIERSAISYARIHWHKGGQGVGDLELVRAVPTGALRRRLSLLMPGIAGPDRVWAIIRGVEASLAAGDGQRPLSQRLDEDERVLWAARPTFGWRVWIPGGREIATSCLGMLVALAFVRELKLAVPAARHVLEAGIAVKSVPFAALVVAVSATALLLAGVAAGLVYVGFLKPAQQLMNTRYWITNQRVLIQQGLEELYLDRARIVDVIETPMHHGVQNIFLVLDGPRARALAASGAFGERDSAPGLVPVLQAVTEADTSSIGRILRIRQGGLHDAA